MGRSSLCHNNELHYSSSLFQEFEKLAIVIVKWICMESKSYIIETPKGQVFRRNQRHLNEDHSQTGNNNTMIALSSPSEVTFNKIIPEASQHPFTYSETRHPHHEVMSSHQTPPPNTTYSKTLRKTPDKKRGHGLKLSPL